MTKKELIPKAVQYFEKDAGCQVMLATTDGNFFHDGATAHYAFSHASTLADKEVYHISRIEASVDPEVVEETVEDTVETVEDTVETVTEEVEEEGLMNPEDVTEEDAAAYKEATGKSAVWHRKVTSGFLAWKESN